MGGDRNTVHLLTRDGDEISVEFLAGDDQGTGRDRTGGADRQRPLEKDFVSATVKIDIRQLPHGEGLALPAYQSAHAAGLDLLAAVPAGHAADPVARQIRAGADRAHDRAAAGL